MGIKDLFGTAKAVWSAFRAPRDPADPQEQELLSAGKRYWDDGVALTLADLIQESQTKASGRVQILSLAEFRTHIGPLWEQYAEHILLIAETTIGRMIGKGNTFIPQSQDTWLLLFPGMPVPEAAELADMIAAKIGEKLVGEKFSETEPPLPRAAMLDMSGVVRADGSLDLDVLRANVTKAREAAKPKPMAPAPAPPRAAAAAAPRAELKIVLRPAWSAAINTIDTFAMRAIGAAGEDLVCDPATVYTASVAAELCTAAARLVGEMDKRQLRGRIVLPVSHAVMTGSGADGFRKALLLIPQQARLMHLRVDVVRLPLRAPLDTLVAVREVLRPLVREVGLEIDLFALNHPMFALEHVTLTADPSFARGWDDRQLADTLAMVRQKATRQRLAVTGLRTRTQVAGALKAAVDEIGGPGVTADLTALPDRLKVSPAHEFAPP